MFFVLVHERLFPLLGVLARDYPFEMSDHISRLKILLQSEFDVQTRTLVNVSYYK